MTNLTIVGSQTLAITEHPANPKYNAAQAAARLNQPSGFRRDGLREPKARKGKGVLAWLFGGRR
jgi:hypothetical protein